MLEVIQNSGLIAGETKKLVWSDAITGSDPAYEVQGVKLVLGAAGVNGGPVSASNPLPVSANITTLYNANDPTRTEGSTGPLRSDVAGALLVNDVNNRPGEDVNNQVRAVFEKPVAAPQYAPLHYQTPNTAVTTGVIKNAAGGIQSAFANNKTAAEVWFQLHKKATAPAAGDVADYWWPIPAGTDTNPGTLNLDKNKLAGILYSATGWTFSISTGATNKSTYTAPTDASKFYQDIAYI